MAAYETSRPAQGVTGGISTILSGLFAAFTAWNEVRVTRAALSKLSDRELADIGLTRCEIDYVAKNRQN